MSTTSPKLRHVGFIADGNRRWAREHDLPTLEGHKRGFDKVQMIIDELKNTEVEFVSFYLFSTENWDRTKEEIDYLMKLVSSKIDDLVKSAMKENLRLLIFGRPEPVKPALWAKMQDAEAKTAENTGLTVCICFNYGGKWEIADAARRMYEAGETDFSPETFAKYLYHPEVPDCDLIVRTSGEQRLSGFQLWRAAYSEFLFLKQHFPALEPADIEGVITEYHSRHRRFGK